MQQEDEIVIDMGQDQTSSIKIEVESLDAMGQAKDMLSAADVDDDQVRSIKVDIEYVDDHGIPTVDEVKTDETDDEDDEEDDAGLDDQEVEVGPVDREKKPGGNGSDGPKRHYKGKTRKKKAVMPYTDTAKILRLIEERTEEGKWTTTRDIKENLDVTSVSSQVSQMHLERGLLKRREYQDPGPRDPRYEYKMHKNGREALRQGELAMEHRENEDA